MPSDSCFDPAALARIRAAYEAQPVRNDMLDRLLGKIRASRPKAPESWRKKPRDWLSDWDIERVQKVYAREIPDYDFLGCFPIDFEKKNKLGECLVSELCSVCIGSLVKAGKLRLGIVFNLDKHDQPGSHWVCVFADLRPGIERMVYFDSYGQKPEKEIRKLMLHWSLQWQAIAGHGLRCEYNIVRHQFKHSECGMYCLYFLHCCLGEIPLEKRVPDEVMVYIRTRLFRTKTAGGIGGG